jgi:hypothetical protein
LNDRHLTEQVCLENEGVLLPIEACEQIFRGQLLRTDARAHLAAAPLCPRDELQPSSGGASR